MQHDLSITDENSDWYEDIADTEPEYQIEEYDLVSSPNDFNINTIFDFIDSGAVRIPAFQRNYVWDIKRASKLIESIIMGLPVPQVFLYEEDRNSFLVIDGQQRLMSIYYFVKQRFPRRDKRLELRRLFESEGGIADRILYDDHYFSNFDLALPTLTSGQRNKYSGLNFSTLGDYKRSFELRTIRNVIVKQTYPRDDDSSIHEIFNRLNTGGVNLSSQEIRSSLYHSKFYDMLFRINSHPKWRSVLGIPDPELRMKDVEILLRSFAMLIDRSNYRSSLARFLDSFSKRAKSYPNDHVLYFEQLFESFLEAAALLPPDAFHGESGKFAISIFESVFAAVCSEPLQSRKLVVGPIDPSAVERLKSDAEFQRASRSQTTHKGNVEARLSRALALLSQSVPAKNSQDLDTET